MVTYTTVHNPPQEHAHPLVEAPACAILVKYQATNCWLYQSPGNTQCSVCGTNRTGNKKTKIRIHYSFVVQTSPWNKKTCTPSVVYIFSCIVCSKPQFQFWLSWVLKCHWTRMEERIVLLHRFTHRYCL